MASVLSADRFTVIASDGSGRPSSGTAGAMVHFRGGVYVGTSCANPAAADDAPRILRYDVKDGTWTTVYESPLLDPQSASSVRDSQQTGRRATRGRGGRTEMPVDSGYRSMCVYQGKSDREPVLYVSTMSTNGARLLRSKDGKSFEPVGLPGHGDPDIYSFRSLAEVNGWLFAVPAGTATDRHVDGNLPPKPKIFVSDDPGAGKWIEAAKPGFGDSANLAIYPLSSAFGRLYAGTANAELGCQIWQADITGKPPFEWAPVVIEGGGAFNTCFAVGAMAEFKGALYAGVGITGFGFEPAQQIGPASGELWRIYPDGRWDLIVGQARFSRYGLKVPLSLLGPGLGDFYNAMIPSLAVHDDVLYLGTYQWESYRCLETDAADVVGGYQLWASTDGENWSAVLQDGNGSPADLGVASLLSTPDGLFVGTSNQGRLLNGLAGRDAHLQEGFKILRGV
jgi:hypothetical protein